MKNNYPIVYSPMPIKNALGKIQFYVTSKCYLVEESIIYNMDGKKEKVYKVVFPFQPSKINKDRLQRNLPMFSSNKVCLNSTTVSCIFNSYKAAVLLTQRLNKSILETEYNNNLKAFEPLLELGKEMSWKINDFTSDIKNPDYKNNQTVLIEKSRVVEEFGITIYDLLNVLNNSDYVVYHLSRTEYEEAIKSKKPSKNKLLMIHNSNTNSIGIIKYDEDGKHMYSIENGKLVNNEKNLTTSGNNAYKVYTTESYEDIINSFVPTLEEKEDVAIINDVPYLLKLTKKDKRD